MEWYLQVLKNYAEFHGRATRQEYWMFVLFNVIIAFVIAFVEGLFHMSSVLSELYSLAIFVPSLAVSVRRLHDTGRSGWWLLLSLIPLVGAIILIVFMCEDSQENTNEFGSKPKLGLSH